jgi:hypothetical protein
VWARHCFDITTTEQHEEKLKQMKEDERAKWRDASDEVAAEMKHMWHYVYTTSYDEAVSGG